MAHDETLLDRLRLLPLRILYRLSSRCLGKDVTDAKLWLFMTEERTVAPDDAERMLDMLAERL